jgi:hypothetical protein
MKINHDKRQTICEELERIGSAMKKLIQEARDAVEEHPDYDNRRACGECEPLQSVNIRDY